MIEILKRRLGNKAQLFIDKYRNSEEKGDLLYSLRSGVNQDAIIP